MGAASAYPRLTQLSFKLVRWFSLFLLSILSLLLILVINACQNRSGLIEPLPQHPKVQAFFNQNQASRYTDPYRNIERLGDNLERILIDNINQAKRTVDIAVQELRLPNLARAIIDAQMRGVQVRLILENNYSRAWSEFTPDEVKKLSARDRDRYNEFVTFADSNKDGLLSEVEMDRADGLRMIKLTNVPWLDDTADGSKGSGLMHHKFVIVDDQVVLFGSANFTMSDIHGDFTRPETRGNANNLVRIDSPQLAQIFKEEFNLMWGDGPNGKPDSLFGTKKPTRKTDYLVIDGLQLRVRFSPSAKNTSFEQTSGGLIATALAGANKSIDMALFVYSDEYLSQILQERKDKNVQIRALIDRQFAYRDYSQALPMWGLQSNEDCKKGTNTAWNQPLRSVGVPDLVSGDTLHHKFAVIDRHLIVTGSHNWTDAANYLNDETLVLLQNDTFAAHYQREFDRLYRNATFGPTAKLSKEKLKSCSARSTSKRSSPNDMEVEKSNAE